MQSHRNTVCSKFATARSRIFAAALPVVFAALPETAPGDPTPPLRWAKTRNVAWTAKLPGGGAASPIVVGDRLFVMSEPYLLLCVRKADGQVLWQRSNEADAVLPPDGRQEYLARARQWYDVSIKRFEAELEKVKADKRLIEAPDDKEARANSARSKTEFHKLEEQREQFPQFRRTSVQCEAGTAACTPVSDGSVVFALFGNGVGVLYDMDGNLKWAKFFGPVTVPQGQTMSPALAGGVLGVHFDHAFSGVDLSSGKTLWTARNPRDVGGKDPGAPSGSPVAAMVGDSPLFVTTGGQILRASDGASAAKLPLLAHLTPLFSAGTVWLITEDATLTGTNLSSGADKNIVRQDVLSVPMQNKTSTAKPVFLAPPAVHEGLAYAVDKSGTLYVIDIKARQAVHSSNLGVGEASKSPVVFGRFVLATGSRGTCVAIEKRPKKEEVRPGQFRTVQAFTEFSRNELEPSLAGFAIEGDRLFFRGAKNLYCVTCSQEDRKAQQPLDEKAEEILQDLEKATSEP